MSHNIVGIDLGTTFSGLARLTENGMPEIVPNAEGERITPSALFVEQDQTELVGTEAVNARKEDASRSVRWVKRSMGEESYPHPVAGKTWSPAELSSLILRKLKQDCGEQIGEIEEVVITVPAYFDEVRRKATMDAAKLAGLNVTGIINEPTAAALYYACTHEATGRLMVFDLGGGTFDVTILDVAGKQVNIVCSQGHHELGGWDFDQRLLERFERIYREEKGAELYETDEEKAELEELAEDVKRSLSQRPSRKVMLRGSAGTVRAEVTREQFEEDIASHVAGIEMLVETVLEDADCSPSDIDKVLLVGGSTRIPLIQRRLTKLMGFEPTAEVNVDECVALGAAIHAGIKKLEINPESVHESVRKTLEKVEMTDVCNHSYGTICLGLANPETGEMAPKNDIIIPKSTRLPANETKTYNTMSDGQDTVNVRVTQGEGDDPEYVNVLFQGNMNLPPSRPRGQPIEVTFEYDENARMSCVFHDVNSGKRLLCTIDGTSGEILEQQEEDGPVRQPQKKSVVDAFQVE